MHKLSIVGKLLTNKETGFRQKEKHKIRQINYEADRQKIKEKVNTVKVKDTVIPVTDRCVKKL